MNLHKTWSFGDIGALLTIFAANQEAACVFNVGALKRLAANRVNWHVRISTNTVVKKNILEFLNTNPRGLILRTGTRTLQLAAANVSI